MNKKYLMKPKEFAQLEFYIDRIIVNIPENTILHVSAGIGVQKYHAKALEKISQDVFIFDFNISDIVEVKYNKTRNLIRSRPLRLKLGYMNQNESIELGYYVFDLSEYFNNEMCEVKQILQDEDPRIEIIMKMTIHETIEDPVYIDIPISIKKKKFYKIKNTSYSSNLRLNRKHSLLSNSSSSCASDAVEYQGQGSPSNLNVKISRIPDKSKANKAKNNKNNCKDNQSIPKVNSNIIMNIRLDNSHSILKAQNKSNSNNQNQITEKTEQKLKKNRFNIISNVEEQTDELMQDIDSLDFDGNIDKSKHKKNVESCECDRIFESQDERYQNQDNKNNSSQRMKQANEQQDEGEMYYKSTNNDKKTNNISKYQKYNVSTNQERINNNSYEIGAEANEDSNNAIKLGAESNIKSNGKTEQCSEKLSAKETRVNDDCVHQEDNEFLKEEDIKQNELKLIDDSPYSNEKYSDLNEIDQNEMTINSNSQLKEKLMIRQNKNRNGFMANGQENNGDSIENDDNYIEQVEEEKMNCQNCSIYLKNNSKLKQDENKYFNESSFASDVTEKNEEKAYNDDIFLAKNEKMHSSKQIETTNSEYYCKEKMNDQSNVRCRTELDLECQTRCTDNNNAEEIEYEQRPKHEDNRNSNTFQQPTSKENLFLDESQKFIRPNHEVESEHVHENLNIKSSHASPNLIPNTRNNNEDGCIESHYENCVENLNIKNMNENQARSKNTCSYEPNLNESDQNISIKPRNLYENKNYSDSKQASSSANSNDLAHESEEINKVNFTNVSLQPKERNDVHQNSKPNSTCKNYPLEIPSSSAFVIFDYDNGKVSTTSTNMIIQGQVLFSRRKKRKDLSFSFDYHESIEKRLLEIIDTFDEYDMGEEMQTEPIILTRTPVFEIFNINEEMVIGYDDI